MPKTKKLSVSSSEFIFMLLDKQLEKHGTTWKECEEIYKETGIPPYYQYSFKTEEEFEDWKSFCIDQMRNSRERFSKKRAEKAFTLFDASFGLIKEYEDA